MKFSFRKKSLSGKSSAAKQFVLLRLLSIFFVGVFLIIVGWSIFFINQSIQTAVEQVQTVLLLRSELSTEAIDFERFDSVEAAWQKKHDLMLFKVNRNPFVPVVVLEEEEESQEE